MSALAPTFLVESALPLRLALLAQGEPVRLAPLAQGEQPLTILDVPFISQSEALCGGAAVAMVLRYWGERGVDAESFAHLVDRSSAGIRTTSLIGELRRRGWQSDGIAGSGDILAENITRGRPVVALIEDRPGTFHYIVVVASTSQVIIFHDPARAPMRVISRIDFDARWKAAGRWMAIVLPGERANVGGVTRADPSATTACDRLIADGVEQSAANDLGAAERSLTAALSCPGSAALRELAGLRLLQRRWPDVESLAAAAVAIDRRDAHAWRLLATSRFVQNNRLGALDAWNEASEPRIDLISVAGLERTRQRILERQIGAKRGDMLTRTSFIRAQRRLEELPSASGTRLEYVPVPSGLAELRATVNEQAVPSDFWSYAALGAVAVARREIDYSLASLSGGGERVTIGWRFWPRRPKYSLAFASPAPWGGLWTAAISSERQPFDDDQRPRAERTAGNLQLSNWMTATLHVAVHGGIEEWSGAGTLGAAGVALRLRSLSDRFDGRLSVGTWTGTTSFTSIHGGLTARSTVERRGRVYLARASAGLTTESMPIDGWFAGDTGVARATLLRAHPLLNDGRLRTSQLGRRLLAGGAEAQHWWRASLVRVGAGLFADAALVGARAASGMQADVDIGTGLRFALPPVSGVFRADVAKGLHDGATRFSFVYEP